MHITRLRLPLARSGLLATALGLSFATSIATATAAANRPAHSPEVTIPFAAHDGIENWQADGSRGLWILARDRHWYYARFFAPCFGLQFHEALRFKFGAAGELYRWSEVYTRDSGRCSFTSLEASDGPPRKVKNVKPAAAPPASPVPEAGS